MRKSAALFTPLLLMSLTAMAGKAPPTSTSVLAAAKAASGGNAWNKIHSFLQIGTIHIHGLTGPAQTLTDLKTGASVTHMKLGLGTKATGNNGKTDWTKHMNGEVMSTDSPVQHARALTSAYLNAMGYWHPRHWPAKTKYLGTRSLKKRIYQVVQITPKGGVPVTLLFDAKTHLLARQVQQAAIGTAVTTFSDYHTVDGVKVSLKSRSSKFNNSTWFQVRMIKTNVATPKNAFAIPVQSFNNVTFAHDATSATMPFKLFMGRLIIVPAAINGHPVKLMLDTGGEEAIPPTLAKSLKLKMQGSSKSSGWGKKAVETRWARVHTLTLGGRVTLHHQVFRILPLGSSKEDKQTGLLGYEIFKRFVVRIDYAHRKLTLIRPDAFEPKDAGKAIPLTFAIDAFGALPEIKGALDGLKGEFSIDTGLGAPLIMWTPFVKQHHLLTRYKTGSAVPVGGGVGGGLSAHIAHAGVFMFGPFAIKDPLVLLTASNQGALAFKDAAGNVGGPILKRFTVTFDYAHRRIYLKPNVLKPKVGLNAHHAIALPTEALKKFAGRYQVRPHVVITVTRVGDQLRFQPPGQPALPIYPESKTDFFLKVADVEIDFLVNTSNKVTGLVIHQSGHSVPAKRIK